MVLKYSESKTVLGAGHPQAQALQTDVATRLSSGEQLDMAQLEAALNDSYSEHQKLSKKLGMRHPEVIRNLNRLSLVSKLMTYDAKYFAKNWEDIAKSLR